MKRIILTTMLSALIIVLQAQKKQDVAAIKDMCGCYEITFQFAETFSPDTNYQFHKPYNAGATEWVQLVEEGKDKIVLQHLLIAGDHIIKHWRQDWIYQNTDFHHYYMDNQWKHSTADKKDVKGQWTQKVYQVDDSPRYAGSASWVHVDGKHYWENTTDSPLPRRDYSKRDDYNVMQRGNRHEITSDGWIHEQDNAKIVRTAEGDKIIAWEKGLNTYKKVDDSNCKAAQDWWSDNHAFWANVRNEWDDLFAKGDLSLKKQVDEKPLFMHMYMLKTSQTDEIKPTIEKFVLNR